ncbi:CLUMA_CG021626, isoform A [Clunio marinus]|uniref:CLUMA_CG021626, isoform A n=1 Tax=Clunio marinus TaxID=568069 RepID=A0A1J1J7C9_9DIPT|nr:CLUMA_CG021626, isoform A [Clunio marinus]
MCAYKAMFRVPIQNFKLSATYLVHDKIQTRHPWLSLLTNESEMQKTKMKESSHLFVALSLRFGDVMTDFVMPETSE